VRAPGSCSGLQGRRRLARAALCALRPVPAAPQSPPRLCPCTLPRSYYKDHRQPDHGEEDGQGEEEAPARRVLDPEELLRQAEEAANIDEVGGRQRRRWLAVLDHRGDAGTGAGVGR
jgi:hypothetical protein